MEVVTKNGNVARLPSANNPRKIFGTKEVLKTKQLDALKTLAMLLVREIESLEDIQTPVKKQLMGKSFSLYEELRKHEINIIRSAQILADGVQYKAAEMLQINPTTLNAKIKRLKIETGISEGETSDI